MLLVKESDKYKMSLVYLTVLVTWYCWPLLLISSGLKMIALVSVAACQVRLEVLLAAGLEIKTETTLPTGTRGHFNLWPTLY